MCIYIQRDRDVVVKTNVQPLDFSWLACAWPALSPRRKEGRTERAVKTAVKTIIVVSPLGISTVSFPFGAPHANHAQPLEVLFLVPSFRSRGLRVALVC